MILQALCEYYDRMAALGKMPGYGREWKAIPYLVVINDKGDFVKLESTEENVDGKKRAKQYCLPHGKGRSGKNSWAVAQSLWDRLGYVLALPEKMNYEDAKAVETAQKQKEAFVAETKRIARLNDDNKGIKAILAFYDKFDANLKCIKSDALFGQMTKNDGTNVAFRLIEDDAPVGVDASITLGDEEQKNKALCLVTGEKLPIAVTNSKVNIKNGGPSPKLVSFQKGSGFDSYHKQQGLNAPISLQADYAYTTALNTLLAPQSKNHFFFNNDTIVFWADKDNQLEDDFSFFFTIPPKDDPDRNVETISNLMKAPWTGSLNDQTRNHFYILMLSPSNTRIAVKLWEETTIQEMAANLRKYFSDLDIVHSSRCRDYVPLIPLLRSIAQQGDLKNLPPALFQEMVRAAIEGFPLPRIVQQQCLLRIKADPHPVSQETDRCRAALLKAYLNRQHDHQHKQITMALDVENNNQAYLCGRLFAILERIQEEAQPDLNATIKDRYYGSFSRTPNMVMARLVDLSNHHLAKLPKGKQVFYEKLKGQVMNGIKAEGLPAHFTLDDQSRFAIGYYHQRQEFFKKKGVQEQTESK